VDAACSGNPGQMEYRGVYLATGEEIFHFGPILGTNNIGEFLAIVHALALLKKQQSNIPIYSDSRNALLWIKQKKCKTKLERMADTAEVFEMIERAEKWLQSNSYNNTLIKWETSQWGEIPADFGRK
jgi:ribonuclease HI